MSTLSKIPVADLGKTLILPMAFRSWGELVEYIEDRDHADYRDLSCGQALTVYRLGADAGDGQH